MIGNTLPAARFTAPALSPPSPRAPTPGYGARYGSAAFPRQVREGASASPAVTSGYLARPSQRLGGLRVLLHELIEPYVEAMRAQAAQGLLDIPEDFAAPADIDAQTAYAEHLIGGLRRVADERAALFDAGHVDRRQLQAAIQAAERKDSITGGLIALADQAPYIGTSAAMGFGRPYRSIGGRIGISNERLAETLEQGLNFVTAMVAQQTLGRVMSGRAAAGDPLYLEPAASQLPKEMNDVMRQLRKGPFFARVLQGMHGRAGLAAAGVVSFATQAGMTAAHVAAPVAHMTSVGVNTTAQLVLGPPYKARVEANADRKALKCNPALMLLRKDPMTHVHSAELPITSGQNVRRLVTGAASSLARPVKALLPARAAGDALASGSGQPELPATIP